MTTPELEWIQLTEDRSQRYNQIQPDRIRCIGKEIYYWNILFHLLSTILTVQYKNNFVFMFISKFSKQFEIYGNVLTKVTMSS